MSCGDKCEYHRRGEKCGGKKSYHLMIKDGATFDSFAC